MAGGSGGSLGERCGRVWEPAKHPTVGIARAVRCQVVILQAVLAPGDRPGSACEGLVIEPRVGDRPVQVFPGQGLPPELAVVADPPLAFIIPLRPGDHGLVGKQFQGLMREFCADDSCHQGEPLDPLQDVSDGWSGGLVCEVDQCLSTHPPSLQTQGLADA